MDGMLKRILAGVVVLGLALWGPGLPLALAQVEVNWHDPGLEATCQAEFASYEPALASECTRIFENCQTADLPDALPGVQAEAQAVEVSIEQVHNASVTAAQLPAPAATELQAVLTQTAGVAAPVAQELALRAQATFAEAKAAFASYDPIKAEAVLKSFQDECRTRGVDPSAFMGGRGEQGGLDFTRIACDPKGDFIGGAYECYTVIETYRDLAGTVGGNFDINEGMMDRGKMLEQIQSMNVSDEERAKMLETFRACDVYVREGNFAGVREILEAKAREAYEHALEQRMTPEQIQQMMGDHPMPMGIGSPEFHAPGGIPQDMVPGGTPTDWSGTPHTFEGVAMGGGTTIEIYRDLTAVDPTPAGGGGGAPEGQAADNRAADTYCPYGHDPVTNVCKTSP